MQTSNHDACTRCEMLDGAKDDRIETSNFPGNGF